MGRGRGVSSGGGQSSLGYLFGGSDFGAPKPARNNNEATKNVQAMNNDALPSKPSTSPVATGVDASLPAGMRNSKNNYVLAMNNDAPPSKPSTSPAATGVDTSLPAGMRNSKNNYFRVDGQNCGNFITDRPSTKVRAAPGGGSSLGYLFGGGSK